jgi:FtsH-binding integral membrane protein
MQLQNKGTFMSAVFANLIFQGLVAYQSAKTVVENPQYSDFMARNALLNLLLLLGLFLTLVFVKMSLPVKFMIFTLISALIGAYISPQADAKESLLEVVGIFIALFVLGFLSVQFGLDFRPMGIFLFLALLALLVSRLFSPDKKKYAKIGSLIFALFVVYDTNNILQKNYGGDFINASMDYFLDILNLFQYNTEE